MILRFILIATLLCSCAAFAALDDNIMIQGKIQSFDKNSAQVIDEHGQSFKLERKYFPKGFVFETGKTFMLEMKFEDFDKLEIKKSKTQKK